MKDILIRDRILSEINLLCSSVPNDTASDTHDKDTVSPYRVYVGRMSLVPLETMSRNIEDSSVHVDGIHIKDVLWEGRTRVSFTLLWSCSTSLSTRVEWVDVYNNSKWLCRARGIGQHRIHRMVVDRDVTRTELRLVFTGSHDVVPEGRYVKTCVLEFS
jgi:hypothetical protein